MSDEQRPGQHEEPRDEVEAHTNKPSANDEAADEAETDDEVEAHHHHRGY
jgi:hypothetical protein